MSTSNPPIDNTVLLVTYNHWLKKAYPLAMYSLEKLGLRVVYRTEHNQDTAINPNVMLTIVDKEGTPLYSWDGPNSTGGLDKVPDMAKSFWEGMPAMLAMLQARHIYMKLKRGKVLRPTDDEEDMYACPPKTPPTWAEGASVASGFKDRHDLLHDRDLTDLKDRYQNATRPILNRMVGTRVLVQFAGATPLVATEWGVTVTPAALAVDHRASQKFPELKAEAEVDEDGLRYKVAGGWMEASYGWEDAGGMEAKMSWKDMKKVFGADKGMFILKLGIDGTNSASAFRESMKPVVTPPLPLPENFDLT